MTKEEKEFLMAVRIAISGKKVGPSLYELMEVIGPELVVKRLRDIAESIEEANKPV